RLIEEVSMGELQAKRLNTIMLTTNNAKGAAAVLEQSLGIASYELVNDRQLKIADSPVPEHEINRALVYRDYEVSGISRQAYTLEHYFLERMTGVETNA